MATKKSSGGGGGGGGVSASAVQKILKEAKPYDVDSTSGAMSAEALPNFCGIYRSKIRPILMAIISFLKIFHKDWAAALAQVVAFLDGICPA
jgi:hypothetical protein